MIYVIYGVAGLFITLSVAMFYVYFRSSHFGMLIMGITYGASGLLAIMVAHWWPLIAGVVLAWMLKFLGLEPGSEARDEGGGMRDGDKR
ncbi:MAG: hypothetical protein ACRET6_08355 [Burkholderiales bacterium]